MDYELIRQKFQSMSLEERIKIISTLDRNGMEFVYQNPNIFLFDKQIITGDEWRYCILRCGRRFGKTIAGSAWIANAVKQGEKSLALCGPTYGDVWKLMVPNICSWFLPKDRPKPNHELNTLNFPNGAVIYCHSSDKEIRGYGVSKLWCDELGSWCGDGTNPEKVEERFNIVDTSCSQGKNPQTIITSTPKLFPLYKRWELELENNNPDYKLITGNMDDNPFLSEKYRKIEREKYLAKGRFGKQELYGELLWDVEGALWTQEMIDNCHDISRLEYDNMKKSNKFKVNRTVVALDPSGTSTAKSDEAGLITVDLGSDGHLYVISDDSGRMSPNEWAKKSINCYDIYDADRIIVEKNFGGDMARSLINNINHYVPVKDVISSKGKVLRAEPVAALYERKKVHHIGNFKELEKQMTNYTGAVKDKSPDRLDALVFAISELVLSQNYVYRDVSNVGVY